jgi:hypothetical protein
MARVGRGNGAAMKDFEDYSRSRVLATVQHGGLSFGLVRKRLRGKPWRKYLVLVFNGRAVAGCDRETDPAKAAAAIKARFERVFPAGGSLSLNDELTKILAVGADT